MNEAKKLEKILEEIHSEFRTISATQMDLWRRFQVKEDEKVRLYRGLGQHKEVLEMIGNRLDVLGSKIENVAEMLREIKEKHG